MEGTALLIALGALGILATRFGVDSREGPAWGEEDFAEPGAEPPEAAAEAG